MNFYTCFPNALLHYGKLSPKTIRVMKLVSFFMIIACLKVSASAYAQRITINVKQQPLASVFSTIEKQTGYQFWYKNKDLQNAGKVTVDLDNIELNQALEKVFEGQPLTYELANKTIVVKPKEKTTIDKISAYLRKQLISGIVTDEKDQPLAGATIKVKGSNKITQTDTEGKFQLNDVDDRATLVISYLGYETTEVQANSNIKIRLSPTSADLKELLVVSTGYQSLPKERATGSFVQIDNQLLNRRVGTNILDRLDGITSGLIFNKVSGPVGIAPSNEKLGISIRGRIVIDSKVSADPLIVLDNFPYEGDINNINPNDIESVTVLKDASAASIWGARSGNGVIVITTKKGRFKQPLKIDFNSNLTIGAKPNLKYSRNFINATDYIDVETYLFNQQYYDADLANTINYPVISPAIELLAKIKADPNNTNLQAQLDDLRKIDIRDQTSEYLNQVSFNQQYAVALRGGAEKVLYSFSLGYDKNRGSIIGNDYGRLSLNATNTYKPLKNLELTSSVIYTGSNTGTGYGYSSTIPYVKLADANGNYLAVPYDYRDSYLESAMAQGFLDWKYRPLQESILKDRVNKTNNILIRGAAQYLFTDFLSANVNYQYENEHGKMRDYKSVQTYEARSLINKYAQRAANGTFTYPFPMGGILDLTDQSISSNNFRTQLNYSQQLHKQHNISAIAGAEIRQVVTGGYLRKSFGYNEDLGTSVSNLNYNVAYPNNPSYLGSQTISAPNGNVTGTTNRFVSYFANGSYTFLDKYIFSLSGRKDGANIFGVKTNDKITPLWSAGLAYEISKESFYHFSLLPYLKIRGTYGYNGNVYNGSAYLTASYSTSSLTGAQTATITSPPNPELRWEKIRNKNLGIDFASQQNRISGTVEIYEKLGVDLIEDALLAPTTGFTTFKGNAASVKTKGIDLTLNSINIDGDFKWYITLLYNYNKDKVISYDTKYTTSYLVSNAANVADPARSGLYIMQGNSLFGVYSYKTAGLDPANGDPQGYLNGVVSKDYSAIISNNKTDDIVYHGSSRPMHFGAIRNSFSYNGFTLSANVVYKLGYYVRKKSINLNYTQVLASNNSDYSHRWQKSGDEANTTVPSLTYIINTNRNTFYQNSDALVTKGDHIRLQDVGLSYDLNKRLISKLPFSSFQIYSYINNVGILWRKNRDKIDPDISDYSLAGYNVYPNTTTYSVGIRANFK